MIAALNALVDEIEAGASEMVDVAGIAQAHATTEYHLRRMFSSLAGIPLSEYARRRRMTLAAADLAAGAPRLLDVAIAHGYGSVEAFGRAFRSVHGISPSEARTSGGPLRTQPRLRFRLTVEGNSPMDVRILDRPELRLVGHATQVPLIYEGVNPHIQAHIASFPAEEHERLKSLSNTEPAGILAITNDVEQDAREGTELTYLHGVATDAATPAPEGLDELTVPAGSWAVFSSEGTFPDVLQGLWAATATDWFPSNPWRLRPGPSVVRYLSLTPEAAKAELWLPIERA